MKTKTNSVILGAVLFGLSSQVAHCFFNPSTGKWLSRDPIEERGGINLHIFLANNSLGSVDRDGRLPFPFPPHLPKGPSGPAAGGIIWGKLCSPKSRSLIETALNTICAKIASPGFA